MAIANVPITSLPEATSPISEAIVAVMVRTGAMNEFNPLKTVGALPVTIITAIVSPIARPTPSITAVSTPERAAGRVTPQMVCHRVAPTARAACR